MRIQGQIKRVSTVYKQGREGENPEPGRLVTMIVLEINNPRPKDMQELHGIQSEEVVADIVTLQKRMALDS